MVGGGGRLEPCVLTATAARRDMTREDADGGAADDQTESASCAPRDQPTGRAWCAGPAAGKSPEQAITNDPLDRISPRSERHPGSEAAPGRAGLRADPEQRAPDRTRSPRSAPQCCYHQHSEHLRTSGPRSRERLRQLRELREVVRDLEPRCLRGDEDVRRRANRGRVCE